MVDLTERVGFKKAGTATQKRVVGANTLFLLSVYATDFDLVTR
jgi:hypothetical protein